MYYAYEEWNSIYEFVLMNSQGFSTPAAARLWILQNVAGIQPENDKHLYKVVFCEGTPQKMIDNYQPNIYAAVGD